MDEKYQPHWGYTGPYMNNDGGEINSLVSLARCCKEQKELEEEKEEDEKGKGSMHAKSTAYPVRRESGAKT